MISVRKEDEECTVRMLKITSGRALLKSIDKLRVSRMRRIISGRALEKRMRELVDKSTD